MKKSIIYPWLCLMAAVCIGGCTEDIGAPPGTLPATVSDLSLQAELPITTSSPVSGADTVITTTETTPAEVVIPSESQTSEETTPPVTTAETTAATTTVTTTTAATTAATTTAATTAETTTAATTTEATATTTTAETTTATTAATEATTQAPQAVSGSSLNYSEQRAVWLTFYEMGDLISGRSESEFRSGVRTVCENLTSVGINTVYVHARAHGDAFYDSDIFPWAAECGDGIDDNPGYDPLAIFTDIAHSYELSVHAWINPLRLMDDSDIKAISDSYTIKKWYNSSAKGTYIVNVGGYWYLNPAYAETVKLVTDGVAEIVNNYDIDGIHIDDYFYPTTDTSFDSAAYSQFGSGSLSSWRLYNINNLVRQMYLTVKNIDSSVLFGISPQGSVSNCYEKVFADVRRWASEAGYCDYLVPQIYYGFDNSTLPFESCAKEWAAMNTEPSVKLIAGLAMYKAGTEDRWAGDGRYEWQSHSDIIARQTELFLSIGGTDGVAYYRYDNMFGSMQNDFTKSELSKIKELLT